MKISADFVTNSSSASFTILKEKLTSLQTQMIHEHIDVGRAIATKDGHIIYDYAWVIIETEDIIQGSTSMDNFDMRWFLNKIGIPYDDIDYGD